MKKNAKTEAKQEQFKAREQTRPVAEMTGSALKNYEHAVRTGLKMQEEASRWWTTVMNQASFTQEWQKRMSEMSGMANKFVPLAQRRMEDVMGLMEKNSRTSAELMRKAVDAVQSPALAESQSKWMDFWTSSMGAMRSNAEAMTEISSKAIDSWIDFLRKNTEITEVRVPKAAA